MDDLGFEQTVDRLDHGIVITVSDAADRGLDTNFYQPLCVFDRQILAAAVGAVSKPHRLHLVGDICRDARQLAAVDFCLLAPLI